MDKKKILALFAERIAADLHTLTQSALSAHDAATNKESKPENEYDTRGLEASYLAGAQSKRAMELQEQLDQYRHVDVKTFTEATAIASTALIELESEGKPHYYLLMPQGGGRTLSFDGKTIAVVTPQSPLGEALLGRRVGDEIEVTLQGRLRDYTVSRVW